MGICAQSQLEPAAGSLFGVLTEAALVGVLTDAALFVVLVTAVNTGGIGMFPVWIAFASASVPLFDSFVSSFLFIIQTASL